MDWSNFIKFLDRHGACGGPVEWVKNQPSAAAAFAACPNGNWLIWLATHLSDGPGRRGIIQGLASMVDDVRARELAVIHESAKAIVFDADHGILNAPSHLSHFWKTGTPTKSLNAQDHLLYFRKAIGAPVGKMPTLTHPDQMSTLAMVCLAQASVSSSARASTILAQAALAQSLQARVHSGRPSDAMTGADLVRFALADWTAKEFPAHIVNYGPR